jgi:hypothetical protein
MITLYAFGPQFDLPDPSPFVTKAEVLLKMAKLPYEINLKGFRKAPKGKLPYIKDDGELIADSTFIRRHLETRHKIDFDRGLSAEQKAIAWAFEKLAEDHLYWAIVDARWTIDANFDKGPRKFFEVVPAPVRSLVVPMIRRQVRSICIPRHGAPQPRRDRGAWHEEYRRDRDLSRAEVILHGSGANRGRCHHVRVRGRHAVPDLRHPTAHGS